MAGQQLVIKLLCLLADLQADVAPKLEVVSIHAKVLHNVRIVHIVWKMGWNGEITETHHLL